MSGNHLLIVKIHRRSMARVRGGKYRRLAMEQLECRWLLSGAAGATAWLPAAASAPGSATTSPAAAPANIRTANLPAAPVAASATAGPAAAPVAAIATTLPAAASDADCDGEGGWADVGPSTAGNDGDGSNNQTNSVSSTWSSSGADQLPVKKPGLLVLSPDELGARAAGEGGLVDVTRISNQPPMALLDAAPSTGGNGIALRPVSGGDGSADPELSALPTVKLEGLRGTSQAFDVAASPVSSTANGAMLNDASAELRFRPAAVWPTPMLQHLRPENGGMPPTSAAPVPGDGKTTSMPASPPAVVPLGSSAGALRTADAHPSTSVTESDSNAKNLHEKAHDRVIAHLADIAHDLSAAARLNDRRVDAAVVAVALAALPYRRFRKRHDASL